MAIDNKTRFKISNKHTNEFGVYSMDYLVTPARLERIVETVMMDTVETGNIIRESLVYPKLHTSVPLPPGATVSRACLYLATCCYIDEIESCKSIINAIVDIYDISIENSKDPGDIKDMLKEIVKEIIDKHSYTFEAIALKCDKESNV